MSFILYCFSFTNIYFLLIFVIHFVYLQYFFSQIVGSYASEVESLSDAEIAQEATTTLRAMFSGESRGSGSGSGSGSGLTVPDPIGCTHSQWGCNPFSRGSWSYFPYRGDQHCEVPCSVRYALYTVNG